MSGAALPYAMLCRFAALALLCSALWPASAQSAPQVATSPAPAAPTTPKPAAVRVLIKTSVGPITLELEKERAPATTANFLHYVDTRRFDGAVFYRAMRLGGGLGLIQAGLQNDPRRLFPPVRHEPTTQTGLSNTDGAVAMARDKPGSATADFFISIGDLSQLDAKPGAPGDNLGFAAFGHVIDGMDVVHRIEESPVSPTAGDPGLKGQMLAPAVKIISVRRAP